jgi:phosphoketolase
MGLETPIREQEPVGDKQSHLLYLDMEFAIRHCTKGIGIWDWASNDEDREPELVTASGGGAWPIAVGSGWSSCSRSGSG